MVNVMCLLIAGMANGNVILIHIQGLFMTLSSLPMTGVTCPDCGHGGGSEYPCWCHKCHKLGEKILMLPSTNGRITSNWGEHFRKLPQELVRKYPHAGIKTP